VKTPPLLPGWLLLATLIAFGVAMCVSGCASFDYEWKQTRPASFKPWFVVTVSDPDATCRHVGTDTQGRNGRIQACAQWKPQGCTIYVGKDAPAWLISHEEQHCEGWTH
jgi:hypothetical protein